MRLSQAIQVGALISPETNATFFQTGWDGEHAGVVATDALGAAYESRYGKQYAHPSDEWHAALAAAFPELSENVMLYGNSMTLEAAIVQLQHNDGMTRKQVAEWVKRWGW